MAVRKFELLNDLPNAKAGEIFVIAADTGALVREHNQYSVLYSKEQLQENDILNPDKGWFREVRRNKYRDGYILQAKTEAETAATRLRFLATLAEAGFHFTNWDRRNGTNKVFFEIDDYPGDEDYPNEILTALDNCFTEEKR